MAPRGQRNLWPGAETQLATARATEVRQLTGNAKVRAVCALLSTAGTFLPGNPPSTLERRWVVVMALNGDKGPVARLPSRGVLPAAVLDAPPALHTRLTVADIPHQ